MNISRTPIREALERIKEEVLVEYIPNCGVVVIKMLSMMPLRFIKSEKYWIR
jgi:DNA-binding GntR family transcriptional regulator